MRILLVLLLVLVGFVQIVGADNLEKAIADVQQRSKRGEYGELRMTPLHVAARENAHELVVALLEGGADIEATNSDGDTPLHQAALGKAREAASELIARGANVNATDNYGHTPLHVAAWQNAHEIAAELIGHGSDLNARDRRGLKPSSHAFYNDAHETKAVFEAERQRQWEAEQQQYEAERQRRKAEEREEQKRREAEWEAEQKRQHEVYVQEEKLARSLREKGGEDLRLLQLQQAIQAFKQDQCRVDLFLLCVPVTHRREGLLWRLSCRNCERLRVRKSDPLLQENFSALMMDLLDAQCMNLLNSRDFTIPLYDIMERAGVCFIPTLDLTK